MRRPEFTKEKNTESQCAYRSQTQPSPSSLEYWPETCIITLRQSTQTSRHPPETVCCFLYFDLGFLGSDQSSTAKQGNNTLFVGVRQGKIEGTARLRKGYQALRAVIKGRCERMISTRQMLGSNKTLSHQHFMS